MEEAPGSNGGKKVIFLYPPSIINDVIVELSRREFEVYLAQDHAKLARYLRQHDDCLVYVNIDTALKESDWEAWLVERLAEKKSTGYGIVSYNENKALAEKYLLDIGITCGFVILKMGIGSATNILLKTLEANEAHGRRKYIRSAPNPGPAEFNVDINGHLERGQIQDISIVGMAVRFEVPPRLANGLMVENFQLSLKGVRVKLSAVVYGTRDDPQYGKTFIFIFNPKSVNEETRDRIRTFVRRSLQDVFDKDLEIL
jgi:hypothetical protein